MTKLISHENKVLLRQQNLKESENNLKDDIVNLTKIRKTRKVNGKSIGTSF